MVVPSVLSEENFTVGAVLILGVEILVSPFVYGKVCGGSDDGVFHVGVRHVLVRNLVTNLHCVNVADRHFVSLVCCFVRVDVSSIRLRVVCVKRCGNFIASVFCGWRDCGSSRPIQPEQGWVSLILCD